MRKAVTVGIVCALMLCAASTVINGDRTVLGFFDLSGGSFRPPEVTAANLPGAAAVAGRIYMITDAAAVGACTTGGGTTRVGCRSTGAAYECVWNCSAAGGGGGGSSYYQTVKGGGEWLQTANTTAQAQRGNVEFRYGLAASDDGTNTVVDSNPADARIVSINEEWIGTAAGGQYGWFYDTIAGTNTASGLFSGQAWTNPGVVVLTAGSASPAAGNGVCANLAHNSGNYYLGALGANAGWQAVWVFKLGQTAATRFRIGVYGGGYCFTSIDPASSMGLRWDTNAGDATTFQFYVKGASGADVTADSGVTADTSYHTLVLYSTAAGTIRMQLDGGGEKSFCASGCNATLSIPTASMDPMAQLATDAAASKSATLDAFRYAARVGTSAVNKRN
jgi:hypothetical protein